MARRRCAPGRVGRVAPDRCAVEEARRGVQAGTVADGGEAQDRAAQVTPWRARACRGERRERPGDRAPRGRRAGMPALMSVVSPSSSRTASANDVRSGVRAEAGGAPAVAGGEKTAEEVVAGGRKALTPGRRAAPPRRAWRRGARPARRGRDRERPASVAPPWRRTAALRLSSGAMRKSVAARSCSASSSATPTRQRSPSPRSGRAGSATSRRAEAQST